MSRRASPRVAGYATLTAIGLVAALALRRPELAVLSVPFALVLAVGLQRASDPNVEVEVTLASDRALEGNEVDGEIAVSAATGVDRLEILVVLPPGLEAADGDDAVALRLSGGDERTIPVRLRPARWGLYDVGVSLRVALVDDEVVPPSGGTPVDRAQAVARDVVAEVRVLDAVALRTGDLASGEGLRLDRGEDPAHRFFPRIRLQPGRVSEATLPDHEPEHVACPHLDLPDVIETPPHRS